MSDKVYLPETISRSPFPNEEYGSSEGAKTETVKQVYAPGLVNAQSLPKPQYSSEVISSSLNTLSRNILGQYTFSSLGAIAIGKYSSGVTGDIKISPSGIVGRNSSGVTTFAIDGTTGDATFKGTIVAGSVVTGYVEVGGSASDVNSGTTTISGGKITANSISADRIVTDSLVVGTNVGLGTAQTAGQVTTIVGNTITTGYVNALNITALGTVTAGSLAGVNISIGSGDNIFKADSNGIYLGDSTYADASFRVNMEGDVIASSLTLTNASIGSGSSYTGNVIAEAYIGNLNASKITAGTINADRIASGSIVTSKLASNLTLSGYAQVSSQLTVGYAPNTSGNFSLRLGGTYGDRIYFNEGNDKLELDADLTVAGSTYISTGSISFSNGKVLTVSADKSAIVPTSKGFNALYCAESPEVWFFDFAESKDKIDLMFEEVTTGDKHFIKTEGGQYLVFARRDGHEHKRFESKTEEEFIKNERFLRLAKVQRG